MRRTGAILYLVMISFVAFVLGDSFGQFMTVVAVLGWVTVAGMAIYMVLFRGMRFSLFKDEPQAEATAFQDGDRAVTALEVPSDARVVVVEPSEGAVVAVKRD